MERLDADISSVDTPLEWAPEILQTVRMDAAIDVFNRVIYDLMNEVLLQTAIGHERIGIERRASFDMFLNLGVQFLPLATADNLGADVAATLKQSHHSGLIFTTGASDAPLALAFVHVPSLTTDESFVRLDLAAQLTGGVFIPKHEPDAMIKEPCCLLCDA